MTDFLNLIASGLGGSVQKNWCLFAIHADCVLCSTSDLKLLLDTPILDDCKYQILTLATVDDRLAKDTNDEPTEDTIARDRLESAATVVQPPGRSANPFDPSVGAVIFESYRTG